MISDVRSVIIYHEVSSEESSHRGLRPHDQTVPCDPFDRCCSKQPGFAAAATAPSHRAAPLRCIALPSDGSTGARSKVKQFESTSNRISDFRPRRVIRRRTSFDISDRKLPAIAIRDREFQSMKSHLELKFPCDRPIGSGSRSEI